MTPVSKAHEVTLVFVVMILGALKCRRIVVGNFYLYPNTFFERKRKVVSKNGFLNIRMLTGEIVSLFPKKDDEENLME
jgi:hypothetical protein